MGTEAQASTQFVIWMPSMLVWSAIPNVVRVVCAVHIKLRHTASGNDTFNYTEVFTIQGQLQQHKWSEFQKVNEAHI